MKRGDKAGFIIAVMLAAILLFYCHSDATHRYISPTGSNSASGTDAGNAWLTYAYARNNVSQWDTLYVMGGDWRESISSSPYTVTFLIDFSGTAGHPKGIKNAPGYGRFNVYGYGDSAYTVADPPLNVAVAFRGGVHDVFIDSAYVKYSACGIDISGDIPSYNVSITNCVVCSTGNINSNNAGENNGGVRVIQSPAHHITVDRCTFFTNWERPSGTGVNAGGIWLYSTSHSTFTNNVIYDEDGVGDYHGAIMLKNRNGASDTSIMGYNTIAYNKIYGSNIGIRIYHLGNYNSIDHNQIWNCDRGIEVDGGFISYSCSNNGNLICNNTIFNCSQFGIGTDIWYPDEDTVDSLTIWNNIVYSPTGGHGLGIWWINYASIPITKLYSDYNCFYNVGVDSVNNVGWGTESGHAAFPLSGHRAAHVVDLNSSNANPHFLSTTYGNANFLKIDTTSDSPALHGGRPGYPSYMGAIDPYEGSASHETTFTISGTITRNDSGLAGVSILGTVTDDSGYYSVEHDSAWSGTAAPYLIDNTFNPTSRNYTLTSNQSAQNYIATYTGGQTPAAATIRMKVYK